jgi:hypothetical protein
MADLFQLKIRYEFMMPTIKQKFCIHDGKIDALYAESAGAIDWAPQA